MRLGGSINLAVSAKVGLGGHKAALADNEVGVGIEILKLLKSGDSLLEPRGNSLIGTLGGELGQPDRLVTASLVGLVEVVKEGLTVLNLGVPVNVAEVVVTLFIKGVTSGDESLQPLETLTRVAAVGDARGTDESLLGILVEELDVGRSSPASIHVGLATIVRLVEAEDGLGTVVKRLLNVLGEARSVGLGVIPEHGDIVELGVKAVRLGVPVVSPTTVGAAGAEGLGHVNVIVSQASLVRETSRATRRLGTAVRGLSGGGSRGCGLGSGGRNLGLDSLSQSGLNGRSNVLLLDSLFGSSGHNRDNGRGGGGNTVVDLGLLVIDSSSLSSSRGGLLSSGDKDSLPNSDPISVLGSLLELVVEVSVRVEGQGLLEESGSGSENGDLVGNHLE